MNELAKHGLKFKTSDSGEPVLEDIVPFNPQAALQQAANMCMQGNAEQAIPIFQMVMEYPQCRKMALINVANAYLELGQLDNALKCALEYLEIDRHDVFCCQTLFKIYVKLGDLKSAEKYLIIAEAISKSPNLVLESELIGYKNRFDEYFSQLAKIEKSRLFIGNQSFSYECIRLFDNQRPEGLDSLFGNHDHVVKNPIFAFPYEKFQQIGYDYIEYNIKEWNGEDLTGKTILLYYAQNFNDNIIFLRLVKKLKEKYKCKIVVSTYDQLNQLMELCPYTDKTLLPVFEIDEIIEADYFCSISKLPQFVSLAYEGPYLPERTKQFPDTDKKKVLLNWTAGVNLKTMADFLNQHKEFSFYICCRNSDEDRIKADLIRFSLPIEVLLFNDMLDLFSYIYSSDLLITTDTTHIHIAGGLGKTGILLLPGNSASPRWGRDIDTVPYYPTVKIVRDFSSSTKIQEVCNIT